MKKLQETGSERGASDDDKGRTHKKEIMKTEAMKNDIIGGYFRLK
jgi:hypothetical protein